MTSRRQPLPQFNGRNVEVQQLRELVQALELRLAALEKPAQKGYTISNGVATRTLDVSTATAADVAKFVGTLVTDLKAAGMLE